MTNVSSMRTRRLLVRLVVAAEIMIYLNNSLPITQFPKQHIQTTWEWVNWSRSFRNNVLFEINSYNQYTAIIKTKLVNHV